MSVVGVRVVEEHASDSSPPRHPTKHPTVRCHTLALRELLVLVLYIFFKVTCLLLVMKISNSLIYKQTAARSIGQSSFMKDRLHPLRLLYIQQSTSAISSHVVILHTTFRIYRYESLDPPTCDNGKSFMLEEAQIPPLKASYSACTSSKDHVFPSRASMFSTHAGTTHDKR